MPKHDKPSCTPSEDSDQPEQLTVDQFSCASNGVAKGLYTKCINMLSTNGSVWVDRCSGRAKSSELGVHVLLVLVCSYLDYFEILSIEI